MQTPLVTGREMAAATHLIVLNKDYQAVEIAHIILGAKRFEKGVWPHSKRD